MMNRIAWLALLFLAAVANAKSPKVKIASDSEPGQRLILTGHVVDPDGKPVRVMLYAYHTDARGLYRPDGSFRGEPRLKGTLLTAPDGSYEIDTIRPAPYPNRNIPAHIHVHLRWPQHDQEEEIRFEGSGRAICHIVNGRCTVDFQLRSKP